MFENPYWCSVDVNMIVCAGLMQLLRSYSVTETEYVPSKFICHYNYPFSSGVPVSREGLSYKCFDGITSGLVEPIPNI